MKVIVQLILICLLFGMPNFAQEKPQIVEEEKEESASKWDKTGIQVIGQKDKDIKRIPGSATIIDTKKLNETRPGDAMEILRSVPGASIRYQDPAGLTMNLGFRGVSNEVSRKVLVLEDGIPVSLNPYGEPEMYYSPSIERMEKIEVVKGSGSILFGPSTIGGVVNLITRKPTSEPKLYTHTLGGENGYFSTFTGYGGLYGKTGADLSVLRRQGDGFRNSQSFRVNEVNLKTVTELNEKNHVTLKIGLHQQSSSATYLGLTTGMYNNYGTKKNYYDPNRIASGKNPLKEPGTYEFQGKRANPAEQDKREIERWSVVAGHEYAFGEKTKLITKFYSYGTKRNWARQDYDRNTKTGETPSSATMTMFDGEPYTDRPGDSIWMKNTMTHRDRNYLVAGMESRFQTDFVILGMNHELDLGGKYEFDRAHVTLLTGSDTPDFILPAGNGNKYVFLSSPYSLNQSGALRDDEVRNAKAYSGWLQDRISLTQKLAVIPGVRYESISQGRMIRRGRQFNEISYSNFGSSTYQMDREGKNTTQIVLPGFGVTYDAMEKLVLFAGVHRGFSPARYESAISPSASDVSLKPEVSWNYETGIRGELTKYLYLQSAVYLLDYDEQIVNSSAAGGSLGSRPVNAGRSIHKGLEVTVSMDFAKFFEKDYNLGLEINASVNDARSNQYTYNADALAKNKLDPLLQIDTNGNHLPYVSREMYNPGIFLRLKSGFFARTDYIHYSKQYHDLNNTKSVYWYDAANSSQKNALTYLGYSSDASGTTGIIPEFGLLNLSFGFKHPEKKWSIFITGKNIQNKDYISTRLPEGIQPGPKRQINFGFSLEL